MTEVGVHPPMLCTEGGDEGRGDESLSRTPQTLAGREEGETNEPTHSANDFKRMGAVGQGGELGPSQEEGQERRRRTRSSPDLYPGNDSASTEREGRRERGVEESTRGTA